MPRRQEPLVRLANEYLASRCKYLGMLAQIGQGVEAISRETITFSVHIGKPFNRKCGFETEKSQRDVVYNVRNMYLFHLGDLLPCPKFEAIYSDHVLDIHEKEFTGEFYTPSILDLLPPTLSLPCTGKPLQRVICCFDREREQCRAPFKRLWGALEE